MPVQLDIDTFLATRERSERLASPLSPEDQQVQSMPDVSPTKWHLAHTTWFFEEFLLARDPSYERHHPQYGFLFNSYYEAVGARHPRPQRGLLSRPSVAEILDYRAVVTRRVAEVLRTTNDPSVRAIVELGVAHEEQHQELLLMDIKHVLSVNPLQPVYGDIPTSSSATSPMNFVAVDGGLHRIGHAQASFAFDNEGPEHKVWLEPFAIADRAVSCGDYRAFIEDGGYRDPVWWLSEGWATVQAQGWYAPLYWHCDDGDWSLFTLAGRRPIDDAEPVVHVSFYEAAAFAKWSGKRLPTEFEWEVASRSADIDGSFVDDGRLQPAAPRPPDGRLRQMFGDVWEWTASAYAPYPGYREPPGAIGEYNGKFMSSQMVLRGGAAVTPRRHIRASYRNFFPPAARWPYGGIRLAEDAR